MPAEGDSFLPQILSVFFAVFDPEVGPTILYQVPEGLIKHSSSAISIDETSSSSVGQPKDAVSCSINTDADANSHKSTTTSSPSPSPATKLSQRSRLPGIRQKEHLSSQRPLFQLDDIRKFVIPSSALCGRLITCTTRETRVMGFPIALRGKYFRHYFRFNICFVFERTADLSCFEPIVRKVGRVMKACEEESNFLSSPQTSPQMAQILEQLYEDLNSFAETNININHFNTLDLKIFPFYPNPPKVNAWDVPVTLINIRKRIEQNWDVTMVKVSRFIDGVNHVGRIAVLAEADEELTRKAIAHLLYYQCIMTIDIFQYSNMYTLTKDIRWLAEEQSVQEECGPYITKPGFQITDWPRLLGLYSHFRTGVTVLQWQQEHGVVDMGIDVRRFTSFGVIKGFLRRVHRYPFLLPSPTPSESPITQPQTAPGTARQLTVPLPLTGAASNSSLLSDMIPLPSMLSPTLASSGRVSYSSSPDKGGILGMRGKELSPAEQYIQEVSQAQQNPADISSPPYTPPLPSHHTPPSTRMPRRRSSQATTTLSLTPTPHHLPVGLSTSFEKRSPSSLDAVTVPPLALLPQVPEGLKELLNGEHHADELGTKFGVGWSGLERWLVIIGNEGVDSEEEGGEGGSPYGRVWVDYR